MDEPNLKYYIYDADSEAAEKEDSDAAKEDNLTDLLKEFDDCKFDDCNFEASYEQDVIFAKMNNYEINFTVKQLQNICDYYKISCKKMKKPEIIAAIVDFENNPENTVALMNRQKMWYYMEKLREDSFMKRFIVFW